MSNAVERVARALSGWSDDLLDDGDGPNQTAYDMARAALAAAAPTVEEYREALEAHRPSGRSGTRLKPYRCACGHAYGAGQHAAHQAAQVAALWGSE